MYNRCEVIKVVKLSGLSFDQEIKNKISENDGIHSIIYYLYYLLILFLFGLLIMNTQITQILGKNFTSGSLFRFIFYIPISIISVLPIFIILKFRNQGLTSVGIKKDNIFENIIIGIIGAIPISILNIIGAISEGKILNPNIFDWIWTFLYFLICIAFVEELIFRGYMQTRIQNLIKNKWTSIIMVGVLFGLMHVPFQMLMANMGPIEFLINDIGHLINTTILHIYFVYLYTRDNNILAPTIAHAIINFSYNIFV